MSIQLELPVKRPLKLVTVTDLKGVTSEGKAIAATCHQTGLLDKTIAFEIDIDSATLSKAQNGTARLSEAHMGRLMDLAGTELWLMYWLKRRGYDHTALRRIETDLERENRLLREELATVREEREVEARLFTRLRTA